MLVPERGRRFEEIFLHADGLDWMVKIYGPSKDVPFFGGYRMGYWIGDPRLSSGFRASAGISNTGVNTLSLILFAFHLYFRSLRLTGKQPILDDMGFFADTVFGCTSIMNKICRVASHRKLFDGPMLFERLVSLDLYGSYRRDMARTEDLLAGALGRLKRFAAGSPAFSDVVNHDIGSVMFLRANPEVFPGDDDELFHLALRQGKLGILPGSGFGLERRAGEAWFRITTTHAPIDEILADLADLEGVLLRDRAAR